MEVIFTGLIGGWACNAYHSYSCTSLVPPERNIEASVQFTSTLLLGNESWSYEQNRRSPDFGEFLVVARSCHNRIVWPGVKSLIVLLVALATTVVQ
jgi:hypothetical protein